MDYSKIKKIITEKNLRVKQFIEDKIGMTEGGFYQAIKNNTLKIRDLEKISEVLGLPMSYWWADDTLFSDFAQKFEHIELRNKLKEIMEDGSGKELQAIIDEQKESLKQSLKAMLIKLSVVAIQFSP